MNKIAKNHYISNDGNFSYPWEFWVADNFLSQEIYNELLQIKDNGKFEIVDKSNGSYATKYNTIASKHHIGLRRCNYPVLYKNLENECKDKLNVLLSPDQQVKIEDEVNFIFDLVRCEPKYAYQSHADHPDKIISIVVYLHPEDANGTILQDADKNEYDVTWKQNRALIFKTSPDKLHLYRNTSDSYRYTLNIYAVNGMWEFKVEKEVVKVAYPTNRPYK